MSSSTSFARNTIFLAGFTYIYGVVLAVIAFAWSLLTERRLPDMEWWQYLLAPFAIGLAAFALEWIGTQITKGDDVSHPLWKRLPRLLVVFLFLIALVFGPVIYKIAFQP